MEYTGILGTFLKAIKLILNLIILILYRVGNNGEFLGVGGTWNLNEEKNADAEIVASGVLVGFFIYTLISLIASCITPSKQRNIIVDILMNFIGTFMFIAVGGTALHYWHGYMSDRHYVIVATEREVGLAVGSLCILSGALYLIDTVLAVITYTRGEE